MTENPADLYCWVFCRPGRSWGGFIFSWPLLAPLFLFPILIHFIHNRAVEITVARSEGCFAKQFDKDGNPSEILIRAKEERLQNCHLLQELAGMR